MPKTSIYLTEKDQEFLQTLGDNTSAAIRHCINLVRNREDFKAELKAILAHVPTGTTFKDAGLQSKLLKMMED